jgi:hypothetical protein
MVTMYTCLYEVYLATKSNINYSDLSIPPSISQNFTIYILPILI